jgi:1,4-dihydroxy-2-naphthoate octaprenyltransferase
MAYEAGAIHWPSALCALLGALWLQVGANFANDYFDCIKGSDAEDRLGPIRVTQAGLVSQQAMRRATVCVFLLALLPGMYIVGRGGWPFVVIGIAAILCAVLYTGGPYPLGYLGFGDVLALAFFGPVALGGTYYVQALDITPAILIAGLAPGLFAVAILTVNNLRDIATDKRSGKKTLAVQFGAAFARWEYLVCIISASIGVPLSLCAVDRTRGFVLISALIILCAIPGIRTVFTRSDGPALNAQLARTGLLLFGFSVLFSIGWQL